MVSSNRSFTAAQQERVVRAFVSSTFRDMHAERDELIKRVFPQLRKLCEERGLTWGEVDLRWGVTDEQKSEGKVLPICLAEIHRCRPYFIGLLGERYGWIPDEISQDLIEREPWLAEQLDYSVTELEILHGVLNDPAMADHALFYFRDPSFIDSLPREQRPDFMEIPAADEIATLGREEAERRAEDRRKKLATLKERIRTSRASRLPVRENYPNPQALGEMVLRDLTDIINRLYPAHERLDPLDREALDHEAFAQSRGRVYIGRPAYFVRLDEHVQSNGPPLVVLGESGSGKSALLSNWALRYRSTHAEEPMLMHFIGATPFSADWAAMLRRIMAEFKRRFDIQQEIPDKPDDLRAAFPNWLDLAAAERRVVLVLDALNQLEDHDGAPDLVWLPPVVPANIRLILSTLPGRPLDELARRGWPSIRIELLDVDERKQLIPAYLAQHSKQLSLARVELIANAGQSASPLYLRALLDELRVFGIHEQLDARIDHYLTAPTVEKLYEKILERFEQDYERERAGLVGEAMSLLWAARRGLSESELMDLLGAEQRPLPRAHWSPLYFAAESSLLSRSGLIGFFHDFLRQAVERRYLPDTESRRAAHFRLAEYFEANNLGARKLDELPWQLQRAEAWERLKQCLTEPQFFLKLALEEREHEVLGYWLAIGPRFDLVAAYNEAVERFEQTGPDEEDRLRLFDQLARFYDLSAKYAASEAMYRRLIASIEDGNFSRTDLATAYMNLAELHRRAGRYREAIPWSEKAIALHLEMLDIREQGLEAALDEIGRRLADSAYYHQANRAKQRQIEDLSIAAGNLAIAYDELAEFARAARLYERVLMIDEQTLGPGDPRVGTDLSNLACAYGESLDPEVERRSIPLLRRALRIKEARNGPAHPDLFEVLLNLGSSIVGDDPEEAEQLLTRALHIAETAYGRQHPDFAAVLRRVGELHRIRKQYDESERCYRESLAVYEHVLGPVSPDVGLSLFNLGVTLEEAGKKREAQAAYERAYAVQLETLGPDHLALGGTLFRLSGRYVERLRLIRALQMYLWGVRIIRKSGMEPTSDVRIGLLWLYAAFLLWPLLLLTTGSEMLGEWLADRLDEWLKKREGSRS